MFRVSMLRGLPRMSDRSCLSYSASLSQIAAIQMLHKSEAIKKSAARCSLVARNRNKQHLSIPFSLEPMDHSLRLSDMLAKLLSIFLRTSGIGSLRSAFLSDAKVRSSRKGSL